MKKLLIISVMSISSAVLAGDLSCVITSVSAGGVQTTKLSKATVNDVATINLGKSPSGYNLSAFFTAGLGFVAISAEKGSVKISNSDMGHASLKVADTSRKTPVLEIECSGQ